MSSEAEILQVQAGEKVELFSRSFSSVPMEYQFNAEAVSVNNLSGWVEIETKKMVFKKPKIVLQLQKTNVVKASMWDTFVKVYVVADCDLTISIPKRKMSSPKVMITLILLVVLLAAAMLLPGIISAKN